jgi:septal ring factor EnvC (AmiA/AmiB activator)
MNRFKNLIAVFAFSLLVLALPTIASAQWRDRDRDNDDYNRNGRYNRNLESTIKNLKNRSREFARRLDRELDDSRYDNRNREDQLNRLADDFRRATARLDDEYDNRRDYRDSQDEARRVLQLGQQLDNALNRSRLNYNLQGDWNRIQQDLDILANAYGYNNRNNRNNRNGDWRNRVPFPLPW